MASENEAEVPYPGLIKDEPVAVDDIISSPALSIERYYLRAPTFC